MLSRLFSVLRLLLVLLCAIPAIPIIASPSWAVPAHPGYTLLKQPNGTRFEARQWGDEWNHGWETKDGYAISQNARTLVWVYLAPNTSVRGSLVMTDYAVGAVDPAALGLQKSLRPSGAFLRPSRAAQTRLAATAPQSRVATGTNNILTILVNFSDRSTTYSNSAFTSLLFGSGTKSMADYYAEASYGQFTVSPGPGGVRGWYKAPNTHDYYDDNGTKLGDLVYFAAQQADLAGVNFAAYDKNGDCYVDVVDIVHQGAGEEESRNSSDIWSHRWSIRSAYYSGKSTYQSYTTSTPCPAGGYIKVDDYVIQPEKQSGQMTTIGVFAHEYGHALGLPDLYDTGYESAGVGEWSIMASGSWSGNRGGDTPTHFDPWSKYFLGWITPTAITSATPSVKTISPAYSTASVYQFGSGSPATRTGEYFLVENRQKSGFDAYLPSSGVLIWHVDESKDSNDAECYPGGPSCVSQHYKVALVQADARWDLEHYNGKGAGNVGDAGDPYPGSSGKTSFNDTTTPSSKSYAGYNTSVNISALSISGGVATASMSLGSGGGGGGGSFGLSYMSAGTGSGSVSFSPAGSQSSCATSCSNTYASGTVVTLSASPAAGSTFSGWSGNAACSGTGTCQITMSSAQSVTATFTLSGSGGVTSLSNGEAVSNLSATTSAKTYYAIDVPAGATNLAITTSGGTGDADLYVSFDAMPTASSHDCGSFVNGNGENCSFATPSTGKYYILLDAYTAYSGVTLRASYTSGASSYTLSYTAAGTGTGTVNFSPAGSSSNCAASCGNSYAAGTVVTLTATPAQGSSFAGWSGNAACSGTGSCQITMSSAQSVTATFTASAVVTSLANGVPVSNISAATGVSRYYTIDVPSGASSLSISTSGGTGDVDLFVLLGSTPTALSNDCGSLSSGTEENCTFASPAPGRYYILLDAYSAYGGVTLLASYSVGAASHALEYTRSGSGSGTITFSPAGTLASCDSSCSNTYASGTVVTLTATPAPGSQFAGWSGNAACGGGNSCQITMSSAQSVTASFGQASATTLTNGVPLSGLSGAMGSSTYYAIDVPANASDLYIGTSGGTGDVDLYVSYGTMPTSGTYGCRPYQTGNYEACGATSPSAGRYYIMLNAYEAYSGVSLVASYNLVSASPTISVSPTYLSFGSQPVNGSGNPMMVTVRNTGTADLVVSSLAINGDSASFSAENGCSTVTAGGTCTISVKFSPVALGARTASLSIVSNASGSPTVVGLSGSGAAVPKIGVSSSTLSFGSQVVGTRSAPQSLLISNTGSTTLTINGVLFSGASSADYARSGSCGSIAPGASCSLTFTFSPLAQGASNVAFLISSNAYQAAITRVDLTGTGVVTVVSEFAGTIDGPGFANGSGSEARFWGPSGITTDVAGNLYVTDRNNHVVRKITSSGEVTSFAGMPLVAGAANKKGAAAQFRLPSGITIFGNTLYVADAANHMIRKVTSAGSVSTLAGAPTPGGLDGNGRTARFNLPMGVVTDSLGNVFVSDAGNGTIRKLTPRGLVTTLAGLAGQHGSADGPGSFARFQTPAGLSRDPANTLFVADPTDQTIRKVSPTGDVVTFAGGHGQPGALDDTGVDARFFSPSGAAMDVLGNIFVPDFSSGTIRKITPAGVVTTFAGSAGLFGSADGQGTNARFQSPVAVAGDTFGNLYVADYYANTIRKITPAGDVSLFAGRPAVFGAADDAGTAAKFWGPTGLVADSEGNLIVSDTQNNTIRRISRDGLASTLAGSPLEAGSVDGPGNSARFNAPAGLAIAPDGTIYVADAGNHTIRRITPSGEVSTIAGVAGVAGANDGAGMQALFRNPSALALTPFGALYVADTGNFTIRKITLSSGVVTTVAGSPGVTGIRNGSGAAAQFGFVHGLASDGAGNIFAADTSSNTIRKITPLGVVTTIAGKGNKRGAIDNARAVRALFSSPFGLVIDAANNIYVSDYANCTIRKVSSSGAVTTVAGMPGKCKFTPGLGPSTLGAPLGLAKVGQDVFFAAGNGVGKVTNAP